jgi:polyisoprenoid-binding protein YceI
LGKLNSVAFAAALAASLLALGPGCRLALAAEPADHMRAFDLQHSKLTVFVYKQGLFAFAADDHEIGAPIVSGSFDEASRAVELSVDATKMTVLDPRAPQSRRSSVQANMLGPEVLDVKNHPTISFRSIKVVELDATHWSAEGNLTLHGQTHPLTVQVLKQDAAHFSGSAIVRQSAFGITPLKIAAGAVRVKDDVKIEFEISVAR